MSWSRTEKIAFCSLVFAVVSAIAAIFVVPEFRDFVRLDKKPASPSEASFLDPSQTWKIAIYKLEGRLRPNTNQLIEIQLRLDLEKRIANFHEAYNREPSEKELDRIIDELLLRVQKSP